MKKTAREPGVTTSQRRQLGQLVDSLAREAGTAIRQEICTKDGAQRVLAGAKGLKRSTREYLVEQVAHLVVSGSDVHGGAGASLPCSVTQAEKILGANMFGVADWLTQGIRFSKAQLAKAKRFPWGPDVLEAACPFHSGKKIWETHFAFLGMERVAKGKPLAIRQWQELCPASGQPRFYSYAPDCWYKDEPFATTPTCQPRWYLALSEIVPGSENKLFEEQERMLPEEYEVPDPVVDVTKHLLFFHEHKMYPNLNRWGATNTLRSRGFRVIVGYCDDGALHVRYWHGARHDYVGVGAVRKLPAAGT